MYFVAAAFPFGKTKTPLPGLAVGFVNLVKESEPDRRAGKQQQYIQQVQIQIASHVGKLAGSFGTSICFRSKQPPSS
jgi:hypothetical protein